MATFKSFEEIDVWKKARQLTSEIYGISNQGCFTKDFALRDQIRRSSSSIMSNIAEGLNRGGKKEFVQFLSVAKGSAGEVQSHLYIALDQDYIDKPTFDKLYSCADEISKMIGGLLKYLHTSEMKGHKFK